MNTIHEQLLGPPQAMELGELGGHDTYFRRFVELLCMPRTRYSRLRVFSMTLLARINLDATQQLKLL
jgi:hypothetical protein